MKGRAQKPSLSLLSRFFFSRDGEKKSKQGALSLPSMVPPLVDIQNWTGILDHSDFRLISLKIYLNLTLLRNSCIKGT